MPFPTDEQIMKTSQGLVDQLQALFGKHPGFRPAHAKGHVLTGTFTPSASNSGLTTAPHLISATPVPVTARFSTSTGLPAIPDTVPDSLPHGFAIRFHLPNTADGHRKHTDIIAHSTPTFPTRTGEEFLEMLQAIAASGAETEKPTSIEKFLGDHPAAKRHVMTERPGLQSYAGAVYYGVNAFNLVSSNGTKTAIRYRVLPMTLPAPLSAAEFASKPPNYLRTELETRTASGPLEFKLVAQVANEGDRTDDATEIWPEDRKIVELGTVKLDKLLGEDESHKEEKVAIFDPIPRIEGVEASDDPLLEMRAAVYLISGKQRRAA